MQPVPPALKVIRGSPGKRAIRPEPEPPLVTKTPEPPHILKGEALKEWHRVSKELQRLRLLTVVDLGPLAAYCQAFGRWMDAETLLAEMACAEVHKESRGLVVNGYASNPIQNPMLRIAERAAADMVKYAAEFGFTPRARTRVAAHGVTSGDAPSSKFAGLLAS